MLRRSVGVSRADQAEDGVIRRTCVNTKMNPWGFLEVWEISSSDK